MIHLFLSCQYERQREQLPSIAGFDVSLNGRYIIYSLVESGKTSLRKYDLLRKIDTTITFQSNGSKLICPRFFNDSSIVFIEFSTDSVKSSRLCLMKLNDTKYSYIDGISGNITDIMISRYSKKIFLLISKEYKSYSPITPSNYHGFDIYSINSTNKPEIQRVTKFNEYSIHNMTELNKNRISFFKMDNEGGGIYYTDTLSPNSLKKIMPINDPRKAPSDDSFGLSFYTPTYCSELDRMVFTNSYDIFEMPLQSKIAKLIYSSPAQVTNLKFIKSCEEVVFTMKNRSTFYFLNLKNKNIKTIQLTSEP